MPKEEQQNFAEIAEQIEDKSYFDEGLKWYYTKFCSPISERVFWLIVVLSFGFFIFILQNQISSWFPLKINRPIIIYNKDVTMKQVVKKMDNPYRNADYAILNYLIKNYVEMREEFFKDSLDLLRLDNRLKRVANSSTKEVSRDYQKIFDLDDTRNPIKRLGKGGTRKIQITNISLDIKKLSLFERAKGFNKLIELPRYAIISYNVIEKTSRFQRVEEWQVKMNFNYSGVVIDKNNLTFGEFIVTDYKSQRIRQE